MTSASLPLGRDSARVCDIARGWIREACGTRGPAFAERTAASIVVGFMDRGGAVLPISRGLHPVFAQPTFVNEMPTQCLGSRCLCGDPSIAVAGRKTQDGDCHLQKRGACLFPAVALEAWSHTVSTRARASKRCSSSASATSTARQARECRAAIPPSDGRWPAMPFRRRRAEYQSKSSGTMNEPRGPPTPRKCPGRACAAHDVAGPCRAGEVDENCLPRHRSGAACSRAPRAAAQADTPGRSALPSATPAWLAQAGEEELHMIVVARRCGARELVPAERDAQLSA